MSIVVHEFAIMRVDRGLKKLIGVNILSHFYDRENDI